MSSRERVHEIMSQNFKEWGFTIGNSAVYVHPKNIGFVKNLFNENQIKGFDVKSHHSSKCPQ